MPTYPTSPRSALLEWCRVHDPIFFDHCSEIGIGKDQAVIFRGAVASAAAALLAQEQARQAALVATQEVERAFAALTAQAGDAVRSIRAFAGTNTDPAKVYSIAEVPPPATPSPVPPPARPSRLTVRLDATTGSLTLRWKATNPTNARGTTYIIRRKLPGEADFSFIGVAGKKWFVDETLTAGRQSVQYTVQGQRANLSGPVSPVFTVHLGKLSGKLSGKLPDGARTASVSGNAKTHKAKTQKDPSAGFADFTDERYASPVSA